MKLTKEHLSYLRQLALAKGDVLEVVMTRSLIGRGVAEEKARAAARACVNQVWRNSLPSGAAVAVIFGTIFTPVVGAFVGPSYAVFAGYQTFLHAEACAPVRDYDLWRAVDRLNDAE